MAKITIDFGGPTKVIKIATGAQGPQGPVGQLTPDDRAYLDGAITTTGDAKVAAQDAAQVATAAATAASGSATSAAQDAAAASAASTSASNDAATATAASGSLVAALSAFREVYLGSFAADPAVDGNGNALKDGAEYYNTTTDKIRVYSNGAWHDKDESEQQNASNAALSASQAAASKAAAAQSEANSAASAQSASDSAGTAAAQAGIATGAATAASQSEAAASDHETNAGHSADSAAASAANAAATLANALVKGNNLSDVPSASQARTNLGAAAKGDNNDITSLTALTPAAIAALLLAMIPSAKSDAAGNLTLAGALIQPTPAGFKNGFIDGNFDFWDVNTTFAVGASDVYTATMWYANAGTGGTATVSQVARPLGSEPTYLRRGSKYRYSHQQTAAATTSPTIGQKIGGVEKYNGQSVTVQGSLQSLVAANLVVGVRWTQFFGTGGNPSPTVSGTLPVAWNVTPTEQKFSALLAIPSVAGKTLGTSGDDNLRIDLLMATGVTFTVLYSQLQVEESVATSSADPTGKGGAPTAFDYRGRPAERDRMSDYAQVLGPFTANATINGMTLGTTDAYTFTLLPRPLWKLPSCSILGGVSAYAGAGAWGGVSATATSPQAWYLHAVGSGGAAGQASYFTFNAIGARVFFDSRL
jgi:hypothetical protein